MNNISEGEGVGPVLKHPTTLFNYVSNNSYLVLVLLHDHTVMYESYTTCIHV